MAKCSVFPIGETLGVIIDEAEKVLRKKFHLEPVSSEVLPPVTYGIRDGQLLADVLLQEVLNAKPENHLFAAGITPYDIYSDNLNFVFGIGLPFKGCIVSYARLYSRNEELFLLRFRKEITHEMGHVFGLSHCPNPYCVMHFSNSLADTDRKGEDFCPYCQEKLNVVMVKLGLM